MKVLKSFKSFKSILGVSSMKMELNGEKKK